MAQINIDALASDIRKAASAVLKKDVSGLKGFSDHQVRAIAQQSKLVASGIATGEITDATRDFFLTSLEDMARNFARVLQGLLVVEIEKVWNAVVMAIQSAISKALGFAVTMPATGT